MYDTDRYRTEHYTLLDAAKLRVAKLNLLGYQSHWVQSSREYLVKILMPRNRRGLRKWIAGIPK